ncbi:hypothetical protein P9112_008209 [Eukaryota sp. TZLM1-RC]
MTVDLHNVLSLNAPSLNIDTSYDVIDVHTTGMICKCVILKDFKATNWKDAIALLSSNYDELRKSLVYEPRSGSGAFGAFLFPSLTADCQYSILYFDRRQYLKMCGHASICSIVAAQLSGFVSLHDGLNDIPVSTPAGVIHLHTTFNATERKVESVQLENVFSFVHTPNVSCTLDDIDFTIDVAFGGNFFALVDVTDITDVCTTNCKFFTNYGPRIRTFINNCLNVQHPADPSISGVPLVLFYNRNSLKNCIIFGNSSVDRSPCGSGTSAWSSLLYEKGIVETKPFRAFSIIDSYFDCEVRPVTMNGIDGIIPKLTATPYLMGIGKVVLQKDDPFLALEVEEEGF